MRFSGRLYSVHTFDRIADLAGVENQVGVEDLLDSEHQVDGCLAQALTQIFHLAAADAVLAGYKSADLGSAFVQYVEVLVDTSLELFLLQVIAALVDVEVAVTGVAEALDLQAALFAELLGEGEELSDLVDRDNDVALVKKLGLGLDSLEEAGTCSPCVFDLGGCVSYEDVDCACLENQLAGLLNNVVQLVFIFSVEGDQQICADLLSVEGLGESLSG